MKGKKLIVLFIALAFPLILATYLKYCSTAQFDVPVRFKNGHLADVNCAPVSTKPYTIPDSVLTSLGWSNADRLTCIFLPSATAEKAKRQRRISEFGSDVVMLMVDSSQLKLNSCYLFMSLDSATMLLDGSRQVRGYYGNTMKESDRLITEISILLHK